MKKIKNNMVKPGFKFTNDKMGETVTIRRITVTDTGSLPKGFYIVPSGSKYGDTVYWLQLLTDKGAYFNCDLHSFLKYYRRVRHEE